MEKYSPCGMIHAPHMSLSFQFSPLIQVTAWQSGRLSDSYYSGEYSIGICQMRYPKYPVRLVFHGHLKISTLFTRYVKL